MSNFWRSLDLLLINHEIELDLPWSKCCVISEESRTCRVVSNSNPVRYEMTTTTNSATFKINNAKPHFPVVTLSTNNKIKFLGNIMQGCKRIISWNKYRSEMTKQPKNNILVFMIDLTSKNINRLFAFSFKSDNNVSTRAYFDKYYMLLVEIKDFNALIDSKPNALIDNKPNW